MPNMLREKVGNASVFTMIRGPYEMTCRICWKPILVYTERVGGSSPSSPTTADRRLPPT